MIWCILKRRHICKIILPSTCFIKSKVTQEWPCISPAKSISFQYRVFHELRLRIFLPIQFMLFSVLVGWPTLTLVDLDGALRYCFVSFGCTGMWLHLGQRGLYLLITLRRSSQWEHAKISNEFQSKYSETMYLYRGSQAPFIVMPLTILTHENIISTESIYNRKIFCLQVPLLIMLTTEKNLVYLYSWVFAI